MIVIVKNFLVNADGAPRAMILKYKKYAIVLGAVLFFSSTVNSQTLDEARDFIIENSDLESLSCSKAMGTMESGIDPGWQAYEFDPKAVVLFSYGWLGCISGDCFVVTDRRCDEEELQDCYEKVKRQLRARRDLRRTKDVRIIKEHKVTMDRFKNAWDFFVSKCGGPNKSAF